MNRPRRLLPRNVNRFIHHPGNSPLVIHMVIFLGKLVGFLYMIPKYIILVNRLAVLLTNPLNRAIRCKNKKWSLAEVSLRYSGCKVVCCCSGSAQKNGWLFGFLSDSQGNKPRAALITYCFAGNILVSGKRQCQGRTARPWAQYCVCQSLLCTQCGNIINGLKSRGHSVPFINSITSREYYSTTFSKVFNFSSVSSHSFSGIESCVIPAPAYKIAF